MEVLRPPLVWVSGRCYRNFGAQEGHIATNYAEPDAYEFEDSTYQDEECEEQPDFTVEQITNSKFQTAFPVPTIYIPYLIGGKGSTKNRIERETHTTLKFPSKGQDGDVVVFGRDVRTVRQARLKLELLVDQARKKQAFTHFLSLPCNAPNIQERFLQFKQEVLEKCGSSRGVDESIFQDPAKLHLTLCVMVLADERERQLAISTLQHCGEAVIRKYLGGEKLQLQMRGIEYMNDEPGEVDVLYGGVTPLSWTHSLQNIADSLVHEFVRAGLVTKQHERVKLHITLMNTTFRQKDSEEEAKNKVRETFCAKQILKEFADYDFGTMEAEEVHLSIRHTGGNTKYYTASGKIPLQPKQEPEPS